MFPINSCLLAISIKSMSLPVLTVLVGFLDGFNPCAMWVLLFLISLLLGMHDRKRMWILGTTFIVASESISHIRELKEEGCCYVPKLSHNLEISSR